MTRKSVLVTGAAGLMGKALVHHLLKEGFTVRAWTHRTSLTITHPHLSSITGNITDRETATKAVEGMEFIIHLAARKSDEGDSMEVNVKGAEVLCDAGKAAGTKRIMHISTQSAKLRERGVYGESKLQAEKILNAGTVPVTTLRFSIVYGEKDEGVIGSLVRFARLPLTPVIGDGQTTYRPIHKEDAARAIVQLMQMPDAAGKTYDCGGTELLSFHGLLEECGRRIGKPKLRLAHIPIPLALLLAHILKFLPRPPITVSNVLGARESVPMETAPFLNAIGFTPRTMTQGFDEMFARNNNKQTETRMLLRYVLPHAPEKFPSTEIITRFQKACDVHGIDPTHQLTLSRRQLGGMDAITKLLRPRCMLQKKLAIAAAITECTPESANVLLPRERSIMSLVFLCSGILLRSIAKILMGCLLLLRPRFFSRNAGR